METSRESYIKKYDKILIYLVLYTIVVITFFKTLPYTIPFVLAFIIASIVSPVIKKLISWTNNQINQNLLILATLLTFYGIIGTLITALTIRLVNQTALFIVNTVSYINDNYDSIVNWFQEQYECIVSNV